MQAVYDQVVACITKPASQRTDDEVELLYPWFSKKSQLFASMKPEVVKDIIRNCEFTERMRDNVIIRQFDKGDCFYIVLSGKVSIYINTEAVPDDPEEATVMVTEEAYTEQTGNKGKKELDRSRYGNFVGSIDAGRSFGELALINKDCVRNASIIADELTHLLVVNRDLYNRSLRSAQEAEFKQRIDFVNQCHLFDKWLQRFKRQAAMSLRKEIYQFNMPIVKQGEPTNGLVFILKGQAKVTIDSLMHNHQYPFLHLNEDPEEADKREVVGEISEQTAEIKLEHKQKLWLKPIRRLGYAIAEHRQAQRNLEISLVGPGEIIGDLEQGMDLPTYAQSVVCMQPTEIYILDAKNFERLVSNKRNPRTLQLLRKKAEMKLLHRIERSLGKQIPLIRTLVYKIIEEQSKAAERQNQARDLSPERSAEDSGMRWSSMADFIPHRGPLIDLFGPGTVFYRNKMKRLAKVQAQKAKEHAKQEIKGHTVGTRGAAVTAAAMFGIGVTDESSEKPEMSDEEQEDVRSSDGESTSRGDPRFAASKKGALDWETSSEYLNVLEDRLKQWHSDISLMADKRRLPQSIFKLRRFKQEENLKILYPGKKILLRPRQPSMRVPAETELTRDLDSKPIPELSFTKSATMGDFSEDLGHGDDVFITATRIRSSKVPGRVGHHGVFHNTSAHSMTAPDEATRASWGQRMTDSSRTRFSPTVMGKHSSQKARSEGGGSRSKVQIKVPSHQYTVEEYNELKQLLRKKEIEMSNFRTTLSI